MVAPTRSNKNINGDEGSSSSSSSKKLMNRGAWTAEEDRKLSQYIEIHGAKRWKTIAIKSGHLLSLRSKSISPHWISFLHFNKFLIYGEFSITNFILFHFRGESRCFHFCLQQ